ncbi:MAG: gamma carbonic anhydrase family protein [Desulfobacteraceae bacterium]|nr:gamma carbonic anhydrase family protein [Desulfobacteraceae bacterium]
MIISFKDNTPIIGKHVYIAPTAVVIGNVTIEDGASVWFNAVIRGDLAPVTIGKNTNVQDNCTIHTDAGMPARLYDSVTVGHNAVIHGCTIESNCLIGINAVVLNGACVKTGSIVAAGSVVKTNQIIGPNALAAGIPAQVKRRLAANAHERFNQPVNNYRMLSREYLGDASDDADGVQTTG